MRHILAVVSAASVLALAACAPPVPDSGAGSGVGFDNYVDYQQRRMAAPSTGRIAANPQLVSPPATVQAVAPRSESEAIASDALAAIGALPPGGPPQNVTPPAAPVAPRPVPAAASSGPNIVAFALATTHPVGQQMYRRSAVGGPARQDRACARFTSDSIAQEEFLRRGGPDRDPMGVDPDGDGYACRWDPSPFRLRGN